jgi:hypothetical protein
MKDKLMAWVVEYLLKSLNKEVAGEFLVSLLRGASLALSDVAAKTETKLDDLVTEKLASVVEELAAALKS